MRQVVGWRCDAGEGEVEAAVAQPAALLVVGELNHARLDVRLVAAKRSERVHEQQRGAARLDGDRQSAGAPGRGALGCADDVVGGGDGLPGGLHDRFGRRGDA